jgi:hypothetical protein
MQTIVLRFAAAAILVASTLQAGAVASSTGKTAPTQGGDHSGNIPPLTCPHLNACK